jgi:hypothetical protein
MNLTQAESLGFTVKHEPFTGDQSNLQESAIAFHPVPRNPVNEGVSFQARLPNGREILTLPQHVGA